MSRWLAVTLTTEEKEALRVMAGQERRDSRDMAALLVREGLEARGWLQPVRPPYPPGGVGQERAPEVEAEGV